MDAVTVIESSIQTLQQRTEQMFLDYMARIECRIRDLEQQSAAATILHKDVLALQARIRARADAIAQERRLGPKGTGALRTAMRRNVLQRYGIQDLHDLPAAKLTEAQLYIDAMPMFRTVMKIREKHGAS